MAKVELKQPIVAAIAEDIKDAQSVVLVDYRGLTVAQDTELRKQLREAGVLYKVCKNTMMKRAFEGTEFAGLDEYLEGPSALCVSKDDATAPARILAEFAKTADKLEMKAGVVEGTVYTILIRFEKNKLVTTEKKPSVLGPPRKFYSLNNLGRKELCDFWKRWEFISSKINELKEGIND